MWDRIAEWLNTHPLTWGGILAFLLALMRMRSRHATWISTLFEALTCSLLSIGICAGLLTLSEIIRGLWSPDAGEKREMRYEVYERRQMLVIDEFLASAQAMPQAQEAEMSALLRARSAKGLSTVIVSNCPVALMAEGCSRLLYASLMELKPCVIRLTCPDRRKRLEDIGEDWDKD